MAARFALAVAALLLAACGAAAAEPARGADGTLAVPPLARVTDLTGTLSAADRQALDAKLAAFEQAHGSQIAIVMVPSTQPEEIADFTNRVGDAWKIGRKGVGDGVLIAVARDDRKVWISVARALEGAIPDLAARRVIREQMAPRFGQGDFAGGLSAGLDGLFKLIEGEGLPAPVGVPQHRIDAGEDTLALLVPFVLIGAVVGMGLKRVMGVPGALVGGAGTGVVTWLALASIGLGAVAGVFALIAALVGRGGGGQALGGGRRGPIFVPGGWSGGSGGWSSGRGGGWSSGGGGWSSGGGGDFSGGGAGGTW